MELREFAERILFATSLEDKLQHPGDITDEKPGPAVIAPAAPGRPASLQFKPYATGKAEFPGLHQLENRQERGRLLHFFANHELLATELMALVLLKFPDAPPAFRKGVLQTLKDEQEHTRLYIERMKSCGIEFGALPVSGYFWRCVAPMEHPIDYVAGLCLTFEQANLDFARHFAQGFGKVGDADTSKLLEKIYRDEIGHVAYGLKWFRRWKNPGENDWDAFCRTLKFPLSPQRAKGFSLNVEGRRAAGLDTQFIAELNVYSQSKGRTPSVFVFNPFAEGFIAEGRSFNPTRYQAQLARDLENLPQFLCRQDDIVLVQQRPGVEFLSGIKQAGFPLPEFVERSAPLTRPSATLPSSDGEKDGLRGLCSRKIGRLRPWAWSPDSVEQLAPLFANVTAEQRSAEQRFNPGIARLYSKAWSAGLLRTFLRRTVDKMNLRKETEDPSPGLSATLSPSDGERGVPEILFGKQSSSRGEEARVSKSEIRSLKSEIEWLCTENETGIAVRSLDAALAAIAAIRARGHHRIVVKQAIGLAGSNAMRLFEPEVLETHRRWIANSLAGKHELVVEPWLERLADFSVQLEMSADGLKLCGYTGLINDAKGQFQGNYAESHHHTRIPGGIVKLFPKVTNISRLMLDLYANVFSSLEEELRRLDYLGPLGIDAFVYRDVDGEPRLKPIVEINPRYTMGRVMVELMRQTFQGSTGTFRLINKAAIRAEGCEDFQGYSKKLAEQFPLRLEGEPVARIREGSLCLNDPSKAQVCLAVFEVLRQ